MNVRFYRLSENPYGDQWRHKVEAVSHHRDLPFSDWFDESNRVYFYLTSERLDKDDKEVVEYLAEEGYEIIDYRKGLARRKGFERNIGIGKLLNRLEKKELKKTTEKHQKGEIFYLSRESKKAKKFFEDIRQLFNSSPYRGSGKNLVVVISQDAHDIAKMSTERRWTSCMELGSGDNYNNIFCEIERGGLVAYLTNPGDNNIENPLARIHIRRFTNAEGKNLAVPEESVYGIEVPGFPQAVVSWLAKRQPEAPAGVYVLTGGDYSDTFDEDLLFFPDYSIPELISIYSMPLKGELSEKFIYRFFHIAANESAIPLDCHSFYVGHDDWETIYDYVLVNTESGIKYKEFDDAQVSVSFANELIWEYIDSCLDRHVASASPGYLEDLLSDEGWTLEDLSNWRDNPPPIFFVAEGFIDLGSEAVVRAAKELLLKSRGEVPISVIESIRDFGEFRRALEGTKPLHPSLTPSLTTHFGQTHALGRILVEKYPDLLSYKDIEKWKLGSSYLKHIKDKDVLQAELIETIRMYSESPSMILDKDPYVLVAGSTETLSFSSKISSADVPAEMHVSIASSIGKFDSDILLPIREVFKPIPEPTIQALIRISEEFVIGIDEPVLYFKEAYRTWGIEQASVLGRRLPINIVHTFAMTGSDTPSVQRFYKSLLKFWTTEWTNINDGLLISFETLGYAIYKLGINGHDFLPFIEEKKKALESVFGKTLMPDVNIYEATEAKKKEIAAYLDIPPSQEGPIRSMQRVREHYERYLAMEFAIMYPDRSNPYEFFP